MKYASDTGVMDGIACSFLPSTSDIGSQLGSSTWILNLAQAQDGVCVERTMHLLLKHKKRHSTHQVCKTC